MTDSQYFIRLNVFILSVYFSTFSLFAVSDENNLPIEKNGCDQAQSNSDAVRRKPKRRRSGVSNRDCEYQQTVIDNEQKIVVVKPNKLLRKTFVPRKYSTIPVPKLADYPPKLSMPDRWRIVDSLGYKDDWLDPYNRNQLKADIPVHGDWFVNLSIVSDSVYESRKVVTPVGLQSTDRNQSLDVFGQTKQSLFNQNVGVEVVYYKGDTVFRPPDYEFRLGIVANYNYTKVDEILALNVDPMNGDTRSDNNIAIQTAFADKHLRNVSPRYDFDSLRIGIQPITNDFRGFLFQDNPVGIRLFGTRDNNKFQYNVGLFRRLEKDTNSGLNSASMELRKDDVFLFNLYFQDNPHLGFTSQISLVHNRNRDDDIFYDNNGLIARPASIGLEKARDYDVTYLGYSGDGHVGRLNVSTTVYYAIGTEDKGVFNTQKQQISAGFFAAELSTDMDWIRPRLSWLYATGDNNPFDDRSTGFDAIVENPQFAGADTSYWIRQSVGLIGGGKVALSTRNGVLNNLRSSKEHGQSNFVNPGTVLLGVGVDLELTPQIRLSFNANYLAFATTQVLEVARHQQGIDKSIGVDLSAALIYRPFVSQNAVVRLSWAHLVSGAGYNTLFPEENPYSMLFNVVLSY
jgi:hypothetical protein